MWNPFRKRDAEEGAAESAKTGACFSLNDSWSPDIPCGYTRLADNPDIQSAVNSIANLISSMTIHLMEKTSKGDVRLTNALARKIDIEPNKYSNHREFYYSIVRNMCLDGDGNAIVYPRITRGIIIDLRPLDMTAVTIRDLNYGYEINDGTRTYAPDEVLHFRLNPDPQRPWVGSGYRVLLKDVARSLRQAQATKKGYLENPQPTIIVKFDANTQAFYTEEGRNDLKNKFLKNSPGEPWMIPGDMIQIDQIKPMSMNDIAIKDSIELDKKLIASIIGIPAFMLGVGAYDKDEYNGWINSRLLPIAKTIEQELTRKLLQSEKWFFRMNPRSLYAYDMTELVNAGSALVDRTAMTRNEWRDWLGISPDERMDALIALENYIPVDMLGMQNKLKSKTPKKGGKDAKT